MSTKQIIVSSAGLKNLVLNKYQDNDDFVFVFGKQEIRMKNFFAEFISPVVSRLHKTDPTINKINFGEMNTNNEYEFKEFCQSVLTPDIVSHIIQISSGFSIEINEEEAIKLRFLSIFLGNEELHKILNKMFPPKYSEENVNTYVKNIETCYHFSQLNSSFDFTSLLSFVSRHFDKLNEEYFLSLPRIIQYDIITRPELQIESEDSLFDIVVKIINRNEESDKVADVLFLETIEFTRLSEDRFRTFLKYFDFNDMNATLWHKLVKCFLNFSEKEEKKSRSTIIVSGYDNLNLLGEKPNNETSDNDQIICPPLNSSLDPSSLLSYSVYNDHSVVVTKSGTLRGIGNNTFGKICSSLTNKKISQFTEFTIKDNSGNQLTPVSAVCSGFGTLYMLSKISGNGKQLAYCDGEINKGETIFINIGDEEPVSLFGGCYHTAAISDKGEVIFINRDAIQHWFNQPIKAVSLPDGEKASSVACLNDSVFVLSSNGRVFSSSIQSRSCSLTFSAVSEFDGQEIVCISGTNDYCLAVNNEGCVFGFGSNEFGQLGLGERTKSVSSFTEVSSLGGYEIRAAYAGYSHSLFETTEGKILSCGYNEFGGLLLSKYPSEGKVYLPRETTITSGSSFCIAGSCLSAVFIGRQPPNTPNMRIQ